MSRALLWELPPSHFEGAVVAASSSAGFFPPDRGHGDRSTVAGPSGRGREEGDGAAGRTDAWKEHGFASLEEWRAHTHTDLYRLNQRRRAAGKPLLTEEEFEQLDETGDVSSISGGSSSSSGSEGEEGGQAAPRRGRSSLDAKVVFADASGSLFAVWRAALASPRDEKEDSAWGRGAAAAAPEQLRSLRASPGSWLVILARGGHFAALSLRMSCATSGPAGVGGAAVTAHRTFHRYVVRAKQGGRQGTKDATGKSIKSAGSALRRANEQALERDVRELLAGEWAEALRGAQLVWLAVSETDRRILVGDGAAPLRRDDPRVRRVPFGTRRPTLSEAKRVAALLATVELGIQPAVVVEAGGEGAAPAQAAPALPSAPPLHAAARAGDSAAVVRLLAEGADPAALDSRGRSAYQVAAASEVRDAFRRHRASHEDACDWDAAGVAAALTPEMEAMAAARLAAAEEAERERERERRRRAKERRREREASEAAAAAEAEARSRRDSEALDAAIAGSSSKASSLLAAAHDAERAAREERAAAAERRFARLGVSPAGGGAAGAGSGPQPPPAAPAPRPPPASETAVTQLLARGISAAQAQVLSTLLGNAGQSAGKESKFHRLRLSNAKVADALVASGALHQLLLPHLGWTLEADEHGQPDALAVQSQAEASRFAGEMIAAAARLAGHT